jgi:class I fructose-bisphosphate aldolase
MLNRKEAAMTTRLRLSGCGLSAGKRARLHRILFKHGLGNGTALFLPYDQGLEHGPRDFFADPIAADPRYIIKLALEGGFNGIAIQIGLAEKFYWDYAGEVPLILKLNGKTDIPSDSRALSPLHASVEDAVRLAPTRSATRCTSARPPRMPTSRSTGSCARTLNGSACR